MIIYPVDQKGLLRHFYTMNIKDSFLGDGTVFYSVSLDLSIWIAFSSP